MEANIVSTKFLILLYLKSFCTNKELYMKLLESEFVYCNYSGFTLYQGPGLKQPECLAYHFETLLLFNDLCLYLHGCVYWQHKFSYRYSDLSPQSSA